MKDEELVEFRDYLEMFVENHKNRPIHLIDIMELIKKAKKLK